MEFRKGPWTEEEDSKLINYINIQGEGPWNSIAHCAGLNRTGKSCRLRWVNYLCPHVRRGNLSLEEQFLILHLHCRWGNRWSKIAQQLPGRTDNEIKNYWRTRIQKQAKQLNCEVNSNEFRDTIRYLLMPRLVDQIHAASAAFSTAEPTSTFATGTDTISIIHDSFATPYNILADPTSSEYETETSIASSQFLVQQFVFAPAAASASELADCDDVVMANNWSGDLTDGVVSGLTWGSLTGVCEQDRFDDGDGALPLLENRNAWLGGGGSIDAMLINDVGARV